VTRGQYLWLSRKGEALYYRGSYLAAERIFHDLVQRMEEGMGYAGPEADCDRARALVQLGRCLRERGLAGQEEQPLRHALAVLSTVDADNPQVPHVLCFAQCELADMLAAQGRYSEAQTAYEVARDISIKLRDTRNKAVILAQLGALALRRHDYPEARRCYNESLEQFQTLGEPAAVAVSWHQLGMVAQLEAVQAPGQRQLELWVEAEEAYRQSLRLKESRGDWVAAAGTANQLAQLAHFAGRPADAERWFQRAIDLQRSHGVPRDLATSLSNLANLLVYVQALPERPPHFARRDLLAEAQGYALEAVALIEALADPALELWNTCGILARVGETRGDSASLVEAQEWRRKERAAFAAFRGNWDDVERKHRGLVRAIADASHGIPPAVQTLASECAKMKAGTADWRRMARAIARLLEGEDAQQLASELHLDREHYLVLLLAREKASAPIDEQPLARHLAPLVRAVVEACSEDAGDRPQLTSGFEKLEREGFGPFVLALQTIIDGTRDRDTPTQGLDELGAALVALALDVLEGDDHARRRLETLCAHTQNNPGEQ